MTRRPAREILARQGGRGEHGDRDQSSRQEQIVVIELAF
jgi:hypothetical protein